MQHTTHYVVLKTGYQGKTGYQSERLTGAEMAVTLNLEEA